MDADVVALQELGAEQAAAIEKIRPYGELAPAQGAFGMGLALRHPAECSTLSLVHRAARIARLDPDHWPALGRAVEIVNVHIAAPHTLAGGPGLVQRRPQLRELCRYLERTPDTIRAVVGDFNATPLWPVYRRMTSHLIDAAVVVAQVRGRPPEQTWGPRPDSRKLLRIDHGFVRGLAVDAFEVFPILGSDHSAIVMDCSPWSAASGVQDVAAEQPSNVDASAA